MDRLMIEKKFGRLEREKHTYEELRSEYRKITNEGVKAPERFIPGTITIDQRELLIEKLNSLIIEFGQKIEIFSEQELNSLLIPHPSLGSLTLREMLYNLAYHFEHHRLAIVTNLKNLNLK